MPPTPTNRLYRATSVMCAIVSAVLTSALSVVSAQSGAATRQIALGAAVWFAALWALVFVLAVIALRAVGGGGRAPRNVDATGVLVFVSTFAVAYVVMANADLVWGQLLAFGCAIATSVIWRAVRE